MQVTIVLHLHLARCTRDIFVTLTWEMGQFVFAGIKNEHQCFSWIQLLSFL